MARLTQIEELTPETIAQLSSIGVNTTQDLLTYGAQPAGRATIVQLSGLLETAVLNLLFRADLERVRGIAWDSAGLLVAAGVSTVPDLAHRQAEELRSRLGVVNAEQSLMKRVPSLTQVNNWIDHASMLPAILTFSGGETY